MEGEGSLLSINSNRQIGDGGWGVGGWGRLGAVGPNWRGAWQGQLAREKNAVARRDWL